MEFLAVTKEELNHAREQLELATSILKKIEDIDVAIGITDATAVYKCRGAIQTIPDSLLKDVILVGLVTLKTELEVSLSRLSLQVPQPAEPPLE